jgi:uncharacterized protein (DUF1330 family)
MPKGYWVVRLDVTDTAAFHSYAKVAQDMVGRFGGRYLVRAGVVLDSEGHTRARTSVIEFPTVEAAVDCYQSPEYVAARKTRQSASDGDLVVIVGYDGPQPAGDH